MSTQDDETVVRRVHTKCLEITSAVNYKSKNSLSLTLCDSGNDSDF